MTTKIYRKASVLLFCGLFWGLGLSAASSRESGNPFESYEQVNNELQELSREIGDVNEILDQLDAADNAQSACSIILGLSPFNDLPYITQIRAQVAEFSRGDAIPYDQLREMRHWYEDVQDVVASIPSLQRVARVIGNGIENLENTLDNLNAFLQDFEVYAREHGQPETLRRIDGYLEQIQAIVRPMMLALRVLCAVPGIHPNARAALTALKVVDSSITMTRNMIAYTQKVTPAVVRSTRLTVSGFLSFFTQCKDIIMGLHNENDPEQLENELGPLAQSMSVDTTESQLEVGEATLENENVLTLENQ